MTKAQKREAALIKRFQNMNIDPYELTVLAMASNSNPVGKLILQRASLYLSGFPMGTPGRTTEAFDPQKDHKL